MHDRLAVIGGRQGFLVAAQHHADAAFVVHVVAVRLARHFGAVDVELAVLHLDLVAGQADRSA